MIVCWASATYFQFHLWQFARRLAEEIISYSSAAMRVALALSYLTITCHIAYKTLSHIYYFNILGGVKLAYVVSTTRCIYTCPVLSGMRPRPPPEVVKKKKKKKPVLLLWKSLYYEITDMDIWKKLSHWKRHSPADFHFLTWKAYWRLLLNAGPCTGGGGGGGGLWGGGGPVARATAPLPSSADVPRKKEKETERERANGGC